ncbi:DUF2125 domain-containing protein [Pseudogemmobacter sonorensis]|uniref:DUF2125 domain-containing protein n=1 Tax=Pseudogemmobacter sonorensis TaxID=2989681 RepID=UPI0036A3534F
MRGLLSFAAILLLLWSGYWLAGKLAIEHVAEGFLESPEARGRVTVSGGLSVRGWPNRFDLTAEGVELRDPETGIGYRAPFVQVFAMTWKPWHVIAALPERQQILLLEGGLTLSGSGLMASLRVRPGSALPLAEARLAGRAVGLALTQPGGAQADGGGWHVSLDDLALALRAAEGPASYDLGLRVTGLVPDPALTALLSRAAVPGWPVADLPAQVETLRADARLVLSAPLDRHAGESRPRLIGISLRDLGFDWGALSVSARGEIGPDAAGYASGRVELSARGWDRLPALLVASGLLREDLGPTVGSALRAAAEAGESPETLVLPLVLEEGWIRFGFLPLGPAPRLTAP